jgi:GNAT superfamily N-acetyltransferase
MTPARLIPSLDLVRRVTAVAADYTAARLAVLGRIPGNPVGVEAKRVGSGMAFMARNIRTPWFNSVVGLRAGEAQEIASLAAWYRREGIPLRVEVSAGDHDAAFGRELARLGLCQSGFHAALIGEPDPAIEVPRDIDIVRLDTPEALEDFLSAYVEGWGIGEAGREQFKRNVRPWLNEPGWSLYLARMDGRPAATAILFTRDGIGYLADGSADPAFRGRGLHQALIRRRIADASREGVECLCSGADFLSSSHRNMERTGMRLLFLRAIWTEI